MPSGVSEDRFSKSIQENLLVLLCFDEKHGKAIRGLVSPELFDVYYSEVAKRACGYIDRYGAVPSDHVADLFDDVFSGDDKKSRIYKSILTQLYEAKGKVNPEFTIDKARVFVSTQSLKRGVLEAAEIISRDREDSIDLARSVLLKHMDVSDSSFVPGTFLSDDSRALGFLQEERDVLPTGIKELDSRGIGPVRGGLYVYVGVYGSGKSHHLIHLGKIAMIHRLKVLYLSLEMSEKKVSARWHQSLFSIPSRDVNSKVYRFQSNSDGVYSGITGPDSIVSGVRLIDTYDVSEYLKKKRNIHRRMMKNVLIKQFPTSSLTISQLKGYLDHLESSHGFVPDLLIVDYADIMNVNMSNYRTELGRIYQDLRGIAVERNLAVVTASQANREALSRTTVTGKNIAEDFSKLATADVVLVYSQNEIEAKHGLARLFVDKVRDEESKQTILLSQDYSRCQYVVDSCLLSNEYFEDIGGASS